jgi:hypothetical protein
MDLSKRTFIHLLLFLSVNAATADSTDTRKVLIVPYQPGMHLSDADMDISIQSGKDIMEVRRTLREAIVRDLRSHVVTDNDVSVLRTDHVGDDDNDEQNVYKSTFFVQDTVWPVLHPVKDTAKAKKSALFTKGKAPAVKKETTYINVGFHDQRLLGELGEKYGVDVVIFLNELDIKTSAKDCIDMARKIYDRELRLHYSIFDVRSKQLYGDVAVVHITSATNDLAEIVSTSLPQLSEMVVRGLHTP